jgi:hypothetical protein
MRCWIISLRKIVPLISLLPWEIIPATQPLLGLATKPLATVPVNVLQSSGSTRAMSCTRYWAITNLANSAWSEGSVECG